MWVRRMVNTVFIKMTLSRGDFRTDDRRDGVLFGVSFKTFLSSLDEDGIDDSVFSLNASSSETGVLITFARVLVLEGVDKDLT